MQPVATTPAAYIADLPEDRKQAMTALRNAVKKNLPTGFEETMAYGMLSYVVPHARYPDGYHCDPKQALPFISIASQKNFVSLYHMGLYANTGLLKWFTDEFGKRSKAKLDMGKSCIRFKKVEQIPFDLIGELSSKMTPENWIAVYVSQVKPRR